ncbi:MAG TPA: hypothetical protein DDX91_05155 [Ruminococcaceae bacterium]|nr:hypothetical protein [Oscillospiraceae bacterium]
MDQNQFNESINENQVPLNNTADNNFQNAKDENLNPPPFQQNAPINDNFQSNPADDPFFEEFQSPVYAAEFKPIKKSFNPLVIIAPVLAVVIAAVVLFILLFNKTDYKKAEKKYFENIFNTALSSAEERQTNPDPQKISVNFQSPLSNLTGNILDISNIDFITDTAVKGEDIYSIASFKMGDIDISGEYWLNSMKSYALAGLPEISDIYLKLSGGETENAAPEFSEYIRVFGDVIEKTSDTYFELIGDVAVEENQEITVGAKSYTADKAEVHLNSQQIAKLVKAFYNNLIDNEEAVKLLCDAFGYESREELKEAIEGSINFEALSRVENGEENLWAFDMTVYLKSKKIIGRSIVLRNGKGETAGLDFGSIPVERGSVDYFSLSKDNNLIFSLINEDTEENGIHTGTVEVKANKGEAVLSYNNFAVSDTLFQGKADLSIKNNPAFAASLELSSEKEAKNIVITVPNIFTLTVKTEPSSLDFKDEPQLSDSRLAVIGNDGGIDGNEQLNKFIEDIAKFMKQFTGYDDLYDGDYGFID